VISEAWLASFVIRAGNLRKISIHPTPCNTCFRKAGIHLMKGQNIMSKGQKTDVNSMKDERSE